MLGSPEPLEGPLRFGPPAAHHQGHGRLDVVPRVGVAAVEPRDHAVGQLDRRDPFGGGGHLGRASEAHVAGLRA